MTDSSEATTYSLLEIFDIRAPYHKYYRSIKKFGQEKTFPNLCRYLAHVRGVVPGFDTVLVTSIIGMGLIIGMLGLTELPATGPELAAIRNPEHLLPWNDTKR